MHWLKFIISAGVIIYAGIRLTVYADKLSVELKWGRVWIGIVLLGLVTSLPEAITSLVAIITLQANDLAIGNLLGSNNFNPMLIVVMDAMYRQGSLTNAVLPNESHKVAAFFAILLVLIVIDEIIFSVPLTAFRLGPLGIGSILIAVCYFFGMRKLAQQSTRGSVAAPLHGPTVRNNDTLVKIWVQLFVSAVFVILGAIWLANSADVIAHQTGLGRTFFGSIFLAFVTSLPEMVVSLSALRLGALDLAIGNIFGSNMTNMFIISICDAFYLNGSILSTVSKAHAATAVLSILLTFMAVRGIFIRNKKTFLGLGWDSIVMLVLFIIGTGILYQLRLL